jgi:branched-chain amino acid transport system permease protein
MDLTGILAYATFFAITAGIYALLSLGLNLQWGHTGLFNIGVSGFFAIGAYTSAILTKGPVSEHLGGLGMPFLIGMAGAGAVSGLVAYLLAFPTLRLKEDYLAIATIGIAESIRLIFNNEDWLSNGARGIRAIPQPLHRAIDFDYNYFYLIIVLLTVLVVYLALERALKSPWGRVLRAIKEDKVVAEATGKDVFSFRTQSLVLGSIIMGLAGALYAHQIKFISPEAFEPWQATFIVWVMLIVGGSGNNRGAILGAFMVWGVWTGTEFITDFLPAAMQTRAGALRVIFIGVLLEAILLWRPVGILGRSVAPDHDSSRRK